MSKTNKTISAPPSDEFPKKKSLKSLIFGVLRILISLGALSFVLYMFRSKMGDVARILGSARLEFLLIAMILYIAAFMLITLRLKLVTAVQNVMISFKKLTSIGLIGIFFNNILPSAIGGDAVKAYYAYKLTGRKMESFSAVFVDRVLGLFTLIALALLALVFFRQELDNPQISEAILALTIASLIVFVVFASRRIARRFKFISFLIPSEKLREKIKNLYHSVNGYKRHPATVVWGLILSVFSQSLYIVVTFFMALSLNAHIPIWVFFILVPVIGAVSMAPSLNGLGVREGAYVYLFSHFCNSEQAFALSVLNYSFLIAFSIAGGIIYLTRNHLLFREIIKVDVIDELSHYDEIEQSIRKQKEEIAK